jgi:predicted AlkP superfamily pyrophosphatase or phosphodiesterase
MFCHYCKPDETGHTHGMDSPEYLNDLTLLDAALGEAIDVMKPNYVIVCSDHGFDGPGETDHGNAPDAFIASNLPLEHNCVRRDVGYMVDRILGPLPVPLDTEQVPANEKPLRGKDMRRL